MDLIGWRHTALGNVSDSKYLYIALYFVLLKAWLYAFCSDSLAFCPPLQVVRWELQSAMALALCS